MLWFPPNYSDYSFDSSWNVAFVILFVFSLSAHDRDIGKMWILKVIWLQC